MTGLWWINPNLQRTSVKHVAEDPSSDAAEAVIPNDSRLNGLQIKPRRAVFPAPFLVSDPNRKIKNRPTLQRIQVKSDNRSETDLRKRAPHRKALILNQNRRNDNDQTITWKNLSG